MKITIVKCNSPDIYTAAGRPDEHMNSPADRTSAVRLGRRLAITWLADLPHHRAYRSVHGGSKYRVYNRWIEALVYADKCFISQ